MSNKKKRSFKSVLYEVFRNNYKTIVVIVIACIVLLYPVPYYVFVSGGITDLSNRFKIEDQYEQKGSYNLSYVNQRNGTVLTYFLSHIFSDWDLVKMENYQISEYETFEEVLTRDKLSLLQANQTALYVAYTKAGKEPVIKHKDLYVVATYDFLVSDVKIKIGDILQKIDDIEIKEFSDISDYIDQKEDGDYVVLTLLRGDDIVKAKTRVNVVEGRKLIGLLFYKIMDLEVEPNIEFSFSVNESGSSAGLMTTLAIYDALLEEDLTHGLKIAGTGTISIDGTVGDIGGVKYKVAGAERGGAKIFFVPSGENYEEAVKVKKERDYKIELVEVKTIDDAINYLVNYKEGE